MAQGDPLLWTGVALICIGIICLIIFRLHRGHHEVTVLRPIIVFCLTQGFVVLTLRILMLLIARW